ncbi:uncharacterized protein [Antedon mediterranea]|uniref:uncharacterized protein n=1 Tax=Antedon mediterranea TaxID=105859 RepID=UPI003AF61395
MPQGNLMDSPRFRRFLAPSSSDQHDSLPELLTARIPRSAYTASVHSSAYTTSVPRSAYTTSVSRSAYTTSVPRSAYTTSVPRSAYTTSVSRSAYTTSVPRSAYTTSEARSSKISDDDETDSIPHRLPKILKQRPETVPMDAVSKRPSHKNRLQQPRFAEVNQVPSSVIAMNQLNRVNLMYVPTFKKAYLGPTVSSTLSAKTNSRMPSVKPVRQQLPDKIRFVKQSSFTLTSLEREIDARIKKEEQKVAWKLSPYDHSSFDMQALRGSTGPYSREFTIHCTPPSNWMKMKWGRHTFQH